MTEKLFTGTLNHNQNKKTKIISIKISPSDELNGEPDLLSLSGQTMSPKLKSPRTWTEGGGGGCFLYAYI